MNKTQKLMCGALVWLGFSFGVECKAQSTAEAGEDVIQKMFEKYSGKWYENLTFKQKTSFYKEGQLNKTETWYEAMKIPLGLIVKTGSIDGGNGFIFKNDSMLVYQNNQLVQQLSRVHDLLVLGFSVYFDSPEETIKKLQSTGLDFSYFDETDSHFILGKPDQKQVWVEKERLLFTKIESTLPNGTVSTIEFNKYEKLGNSWIAPEVLFFNNRELTMKEEYYDIELPTSLSQDLFNASDFKSLVW